jgi:hypothetical protein
VRIVSGRVKVKGGRGEGAERRKIWRGEPELKQKPAEATRTASGRPLRLDRHWRCCPPALPLLTPPRPREGHPEPAIDARGVPPSMVASAGETDRDLAAPQFRRNYGAYNIIEF